MRLHLRGNPMLDTFVAARDGADPHLPWRRGLFEAAVPAPRRARADQLQVEWKAREQCCNRYGWAVPDERALAAIQLASPNGVVEVGAGRGYWAALLARRGVDVVAYDLHPPRGRRARRNGYFRQPGLYFPVRRGDARWSAKRHPDRTLLLVWPPYTEPVASDALRAYRGRTVAYLGEGPGGCTGDDVFHDRLDREWEETSAVDIPSWWGINDRLYLFRRKR